MAGVNGGEGEQAAEVTISDAARAKILELIDARGIAGHGALRISVGEVSFAGPEYGMALVEESERTEDDVELDGGDFPVLVDAASLPYVGGASVNYYDTLFQQGFQIDPPADMPAPEVASSREWDDPLAQRVQEVIDTMINPGVAAHG